MNIKLTFFVKVKSDKKCDKVIEEIKEILPITHIVKEPYNLCFLKKQRYIIRATMVVNEANEAENIYKTMKLLHNLSIRWLVKFPSNEDTTFLGSSKAVKLNKIEVVDFEMM